MRIFLVSYSYSDGARSGFGNVFREHKDNSGMAVEDVRAVAEAVADKVHPGATVVVLNVVELETRA